MTEPAKEDEGVTVVTSRRVKPGREGDFEKWLEGIGAAAAKYPGYVWRRVTRPKDHDLPEYVVVFKFDDYAHLRAWTESAERREWLDRVKPLVTDDFKETVLTGLETWFTLPAQPGVMPPPRYKMAIVTLLVIYPLSLATGAALARMPAEVPPFARSILGSVVMIALMTYVIMPRATRLFARWLYPD
jgi:antibiotic biosynthesis monooxygenase (ABM) superfamily enzyme